MTDEQATFNKWGFEVPPPLIERKATVTVQADKQRLVGFLGKDRRREVRVYTTRRSDFHFYYEGDGYAVSEGVIEQLEELDIPRIIIHEKLTEYDQRQGEAPDVWEFKTRQYAERENYVHEDDLLDGQDQQVYVPLDDHFHHWPDHDRLFVRSFEQAMDQIVEKRGWP